MRPPPKPPPKKAPAEDTSHAWAEKRDLNSRDQRLRDFGFKIHGRPKRGAPTWELLGEVYAEAEAVQIAGA